MSTDEKKAPFETDMNDRERERFAAQADRAAESATKVAAALRAGNDMDTLLNVVLLSLSGSFINELHDIFLRTLPEKERKEYERAERERGISAASITGKDITVENL